MDGRSQDREIDGSTQSFGLPEIESEPIVMVHETLKSLGLVETEGQ